MKILIFEWLLGGGQYLDQSSCNQEPGMRTQGGQMLRALEQDFSAIGFEVIITLESGSNYTSQPGTRCVPIYPHDSLPDELRQLAGETDFLLLVAPETDGKLLRCTQWLRDFQPKFLSPQPEVVELCSDKSETCRFLEQHSIPTPEGILIEPNGRNIDHYPSELAALLPGVLKPNCGAGGEATFFLEDRDALLQILEEQADHLARPMRLETWVTGIPASTSLICGPTGCEVLPSTRQVFRGQPLGAYAGNQADLSNDQQDRARHLAGRVADSLPPTCGYLGIDMILGATAEKDVVVEINSHACECRRHCIRVSKRTMTSNWI